METQDYLDGKLKLKGKSPTVNGRHVAGWIKSLLQDHEGDVTIEVHIWSRKPKPETELKVVK